MRRLRQIIAVVVCWTALAIALPLVWVAFCIGLLLAVLGHSAKFAIRKISR